jgi:hypothetical protein
MYKLVDGVGHVLFESLDDFDKRAPALYMRSNASKALEYIRDPRGYLWFGTNGAQSAMQKVRDGWPEMLAILTSMLSKIEKELPPAASKVTVRRRKRHRMDYGDTLDMQRVWNGDIGRAWERPIKESRLNISQQHVTVFVNLASAAWETAQELLWRAAAAYRICDALQSAGRSVEIYCGTVQVNAHYYGPHTSVYAMRIKEYMQPLDSEHLAAMLSPGFFRTYGFLMILCPPFEARWHLGVPSSGHLPFNLRERQQAGELVIDIQRCTTQHDALQEISRVINNLESESREPA